MATGVDLSLHHFSHDLNRTSRLVGASSQPCVTPGRMLFVLAYFSEGFFDLSESSWTASGSA